MILDTDKVYRFAKSALVKSKPTGRFPLVYVPFRRLNGRASAKRRPSGARGVGDLGERGVRGAHDSARRFHTRRRSHTNRSSPGSIPT